MNVRNAFTTPYLDELLSLEPHLVILPHEDDEISFAGILQRLANKGKVVWITNGDGMAHLDRLPPAMYGRLRENESSTALQLAGWNRTNLRFLGFSEYEIYRHYAALSELMSKFEVSKHDSLLASALKNVDSVLESGLSGCPAPTAAYVKQIDVCDTSVVVAVLARLLAFFKQIQNKIEAELVSVGPRVVWTVAWQGGHIEHDMVHLFVAASIKKIRQDRLCPDFLLEVPQYEVGVFYPLRFPPWRNQRRVQVTISTHELEVKSKIMEVYKTQRRLIRQFKRMIRIYGALAVFACKPFSVAQFASIEEYRLVESNRDYTVSPFRWEWLTYPFEKYGKTNLPFRYTNRILAKFFTMED